MLGDGVGGSVGSTIMPGTGDALAFANKLVSGVGADRNGDTKGFDTLYGDGTGGPGSDLAIIPAADYNPPNRSHFESRDYWFAGALAQLQTGWLGRWLDTYGSQTNPLQAVSLDSNLSKQIRSSKAPVCALEGLQGVGFGVPGVTGDINAEVGKLAAVPSAAGNEALARSRGMMGLTVDVANRLSSSSGRRPRRGLPAQQRPLAEAAARGDAALGRPRHARHHDRLGQLRHARRPARRAGSAADHPLARAGGVQGRPGARAASSRTSSRWCSRSSAGALTNPTRPAPTTARAARSCSAARPSGAASPASIRAVNVDQDGDLVVKTDFRTVYQQLIAEWLGGDPNAILPGGPFNGIARYDGGNSLIKAA